MFGGLTLANDLLSHALVDELHLIVGAVVLGSGTPAVAGDTGAALRPIEVRQLHGSDNVLMRYAVSHD
jgi:riboflavin biosynthesis pyrimidine reductase